TKRIEVAVLFELGQRIAQDVEEFVTRNGRLVITFGDEADVPRVHNLLVRPCARHPRIVRECLKQLIPYPGSLANLAQYRGAGRRQDRDGLIRSRIDCSHTSQTYPSFWFLRRDARPIQPNS